ncbi:hypothetical protein STH12_03823 [Shewanella khirikhana]|uniref:Uncharacterized protein n=1 Tax=Shewanella khirikhana TaxID=1965282 RepID=A0ABN5U111_9GAMM|nr:hypothetical protein STH12_03823 [Shewanella khirikhana]
MIDGWQCDTGHGGKSGRYRQFADMALEYVFNLHHWGLE